MKKGPDCVRVVLRRRFEFWGGWLVVCAAVVALVEADYHLRAISSTVYRLQVTVAFVLAIWFVWLGTVHPALILTKERLIVVNWFLSHRIPWSMVDRVSPLPGMTVVLRDGRRIKVGSGSGSIIGDLKGNKHLRGQVDVVAIFMKDARSSSADQVVSSVKIEVYPLAFGVLLAVLGIVAWGVQYLP